MIAIERFERHFQKGASDECWVYPTSSERGRFLLDGRLVTTSRAAWRLYVGPIPDGLWVLHTCDNPPCVNPDHLFLGTQSDNMKDMHAKGRGGSRPRERCIHGHLLAGAYIDRWGGRHCRPCQARRARERRARSFTRGSTE